MPSSYDKELIAHEFKEQKDFRDHNGILFDIFEGDLAKYVLSDLRTQLSPPSYEMASKRLAPINVLKRVNDKLSKIYSKPPTRVIVDGQELDMNMLAAYEGCFEVNQTMHLANELFNLHKCVAIEPYLKGNKPRLRTIPADRFLVASTDPIEPNKMTHFAKICWTYEKGQKKPILHCYTDSEIWVQNEKGEILTDQMSYLGLTSTQNPFGVIPYVYINRSNHDLVPKADTDTLALTKLIPTLLTDLNYAVMFQAFSIVYGIDVDDEDLKMAPNAFWRLKSDPSSDKKPEVGVIKPQVDITQVSQFISSQLAMWLQTKGIRPGAVGQLSPDNFQSGVSKVIDEMDTTEDRQAQTHFFENAEEELWEKVINNIHPVWSQVPNYFIPGTFSPNVEVQVIFPEQRSDLSKTQMVDDEIKKLNAHLTTKKMAIMRLNPDMTEQEAEAMMAEIEQDRTFTVEGVSSGNETSGPMDQNTQGL